MTAPLTASNLRVSFGRQEILHGIDLELSAGSFTGLVGPNAAGKTTLLRCLAGLSAFSGDVRLDSQPVNQLTPRQRSKLIALLPQEREIGWSLAVKHVVGLGRIPFRTTAGPRREQDEAAITRAMQRTDITHLAERSATQLSGGEQARVLIARALAQETPLLLADEPTAGLDPAHSISIAQRFRDLAREGKTVLASFHDLGLAARWCDQIIVLHGGKIEISGPPESALNADSLRRIYGVEAFVLQDQSGLVLLPTELAATEPSA